MVSPRLLGAVFSRLSVSSPRGCSASALLPSHGSFRLNPKLWSAHGSEPAGLSIYGFNARFSAHRRLEGVPNGLEKPDTRSSVLPHDGGSAAVWQGVHIIRPETQPA